MVRQMEKMEWKEDVVKSYRADKNNVSCQITPYDDPQLDAKGNAFVWHGWKLTVTRPLYLVYSRGDPTTAESFRSIEFNAETKAAYVTIMAEIIFKDLDAAKADAEELLSAFEHRWKIILE